MKKIALCCANGFTTTMLKVKMEDIIKRDGLDYVIDAFPYTDLKGLADTADIILLGPQIRYNLRTVQKQYPDKIVLVIDMQALAMIDGEKVIKQVKDALE